MTRVYRGWRDAEGKAHVDADDMPLPLRLDLANHSPTGFEWGYGGSGPAQLALAILADALGSNQKALLLHQRFKWAVIAKLPRDKGWTLHRDEVHRLLGLNLKDQAA
ncbi:hypothetical protein JQ604_14855 [Bradyrhizobium jicamae]|uniref:DUF6166 domain-containing protein n=1 Tax=Bradyrhizobium jicamae TaxID=280332 RepID=UPI001BA75FA6|nr:DUF6166 domain-containing protein [Bradyrhizobium jicamae]MBR0753465.1 hypothetical protein [Bradyrhizobium jicamae]